MPEAGSAPESVQAALARRRSMAMAVLSVAATYVYFLIFGEFAFLELAASSARGESEQGLVMGLLGLGGVVGSLLAARLFAQEHIQVLLRSTFRGCAFTALCVVWLHQGQAIYPLGFLLGFCMGLLTVSLASSLPYLLPRAGFGFHIGLGTGLAYALCNVPAVFLATPVQQSLVAALVAFLGSLAASQLKPASSPASSTASASGFTSVSASASTSASVSPQPSGDWAPTVSWIWILLFAALIWLDSGAFYVIQHVDSLRGLTWAGTLPLWGNAASHFLAAVLAGLLIDRAFRGWLLVLAFAGLAAACLVLSFDVPGWLPRLLYTAGVSIYSTLFVWYAARGAKPWLVAALFALSGWLGSALGIGMARQLAAVPLWFLIASGLLLGFGLLWRRRFLAALPLGLLVLGAFGCLGSRLQAADTPSEATVIDPAQAAMIAVGREVYIAEGCIHCHSQYVRATVPSEVLAWGPASSTPLDPLTAGEPPLPGNRRQGPDLAKVGNRRNPEWQGLHLRDPRLLVPGSRMPAYAQLFAEGGSASRGEALLVYLASLGADTLAARQAVIASWQPAETARPVSLAAARRLFLQACAACHGEQADGQGPAARVLGTKPPDLHRRPYVRVAAFGALPPTLQTDRVVLARFIKFGLSGTAMAGHEYFSDEELLGLADYLLALPAPAPAS